MPIDLLQQAAANNEWLAITPELMRGLTALLLLVLELILPKAKHGLIPVTAIVIQVVIAVSLALNFNTAFSGTGTVFNGLLRLSADGQFLRLFFLVCSIFVCLLGTVSLAKQRMPRVEFYHLVLVITAAMMLLAQSNHFVMFFVALETVTVGFYILVSYFRTSALTLEAGLNLDQSQVEGWVMFAEVAHELGSSDIAREAAGVVGGYAIVAWTGRADGGARGGLTGRSATLPLLFDAADAIGAPTSAAKPIAPRNAPSMTPK